MSQQRGSLAWQRCRHARQLLPGPGAPVLPVSQHTAHTHLGDGVLDLGPRGVLQPHQAHEDQVALHAAVLGGVGQHLVAGVLGVLVVVGQGTQPRRLRRRKTWESRSERVRTCQGAQPRREREVMQQAGEC